METTVFSSSMDTTRALVMYLVELLNKTSDKTFDIAISGGNTTALLFDLWANEYASVTPWERIRFYWVDELCVPPECPESHYGVMCKFLLNAVTVPCENVFRIRGEANPMAEAWRYSQLVDKQVPKRGGLPKFDLVLLGVGADGYIPSIFQGQEALLTANRMYAVSTRPCDGWKCITMTGQTILNARHIVFLATGEVKANAVKEMCLSGDTIPAAYIAHHAKRVALFADRAAAAYV